MNQPVLLVIVSGHPAAGKTTISKKISEEFNLPLISADEIKEVMWDTIGYNFDFEFSDKMGKTSFELLFYCIHASLSKGKSLVAEAHFNPERNNQRINEIKKKHNTKLLQIYCKCDREILRKRFKERMNHEKYHDGHRHIIGMHGLENILSKIKEEKKILDINGKTYEVDTTNPEKIDYVTLYNFIRSNF